MVEVVEVTSIDVEIWLSKVSVSNNRMSLLFQVVALQIDVQGSPVLLIASPCEVMTDHPLSQSQTSSYCILSSVEVFLESGEVDFSVLWVDLRAVASTVDVWRLVHVSSIEKIPQISYSFYSAPVVLLRLAIRLIGNLVSARLYATFFTNRSGNHLLLLRLAE